MAWDLEVILIDQPGALAALGEALGAADINIDGISGSTSGGQGTAHILVKDASSAQKALLGAGIEVVGSTEVVIAAFGDKPGELGSMARRIADAGTNIKLVYITCDGRIAFATDNNTAASAALGA